MEKERCGTILRVAMLVGGVVDLIMVIIFIVPILRVHIFGEIPQSHTPQYEWGMRLIGSLGAAWTTTLFWASMKPFERKDILFITVFPLMLGAYGATLHGYFSGAVSSQFFTLFTIITFAHCPCFVYVWAKARSFSAQRMKI